MSLDADILEPDALEGAPHPRLSRQLFGQSLAEAAFLDAFRSNRLHHGWLITGPRGVGKATLAWKIARFLLDQPEEADGGMFGAPPPPETLERDPDSPRQRRISALSEANLFLCRRPWDDKLERLKQDITVDEVRKLKSFFNLSAAEGGHRVAIIDAADEMNTSAANALLKILEEPPERTTLLLVSHRPLSLLPTIRSRCRTLPCIPLAPADLAKALDAAGYDGTQASGALSVLAGGSVGEAIRLLSQDGVAVYAALIRLFVQGDKMDRGLAISLSENCTGKAAQARYDLTLRLIAVLLHRLATTGVQGPPETEAVRGEAGVLARLSPSPARARHWAELAQDLGARAAHGRAVNLDPASVILDMLLKIDSAANARHAA